MLIVAHPFRPRDLVAGHVALDLVNTVTARDAAPLDWLDGYPRLLEWAAFTGVFAAGDLVTLAEQAESHPRAAERALGEARALRETLHDVAQALARGIEPSPAALRSFEEIWRAAAAHARITLTGGGVAFRLDVARSGLDLVTHQVALDALALFENWPAGRARVCPGPSCGWLFVDYSRGGRRRWCDMQTCGNAAKNRRHYHRHRS